MSISDLNAILQVSITFGIVYLGIHEYGYNRRVYDAILKLPDTTNLLSDIIKKANKNDLSFLEKYDKMGKADLWLNEIVKELKNPWYVRLFRLKVDIIIVGYFVSLNALSLILTSISPEYFNAGLYLSILIVSVLGIIFPIFFVLAGISCFDRAISATHVLEKMREYFSSSE